jgi:hypothetical protein
MNGWFPDPGGEPGRYRYWDGSTWSQVTSDNPSDGPPGSGQAVNGGRSRLGAVIGLIALIVIVVVVANLLRGGSRPTTNDPLPTTSVSGGDDRSPTPPPTASPSASRNAEAPCPVGNPNGRAGHPTDGRVYGGNLSFASEPSFEPARAEPRFTFAHDVTQQVRRVHDDPGWIAQLAVGEVLAEDGFGPKTREAAEIVVQCAVTSQLYQPYRATRRNLRSEAITVDGHAGWVIESQVRVGEPGLPFAGDRSIFILVPDGQNWGLFFGAVPIGDEPLAAVLAQAVRSLRVT